MNSRRNWLLPLAIYGLSVLPVTPAQADIIIQGDIQLVGGDPQNDGPIFPDGDILEPPEDDLFFNDLSTMLVDLGSSVEVGAITTTGVVAIDLTDPGTQMVLTATDRTRIDIQGSATLSVLNGALIDADTPCIGCGAAIGILAGSNSALNVDGAGSQVLTTEFFAAEARVEGAATGNSTSVINITNGGQISSTEVFISNGAVNDSTGLLTTTGTVNINGAGSAWNFTNLQTATGDNAIAFINLNGGGSLQGTSAAFSLGQNTQTTATVDGANTTLVLSDDLVIGGGTGTNAVVSIQNGAAAQIGGGADAGEFAGGGIIIGGRDGTGQLNVNNASVVINPLVDNPNTSIIVGDGGTGVLNITNGASVDLADLTSANGDEGVFVGVSRPGFASSGTLTLDGIGSSMRIASDTLSFMDIGVTNTPFAGPESATGSVTVSNGAVMQIEGPGDAFLTLGRGANSSGDLTITGAGSRVSVNGSIAAVAVGNDFTDAVGSGTAQVTVADGGLLDISSPNADSSFLTVGFGSGDGTLVVGANATVNVETLEISAPSQTNDLQTGAVTINTTGTINTLTTRVSARGSLAGDGVLSAQLLEIVGGTVSLTDYSNIGQITLDGPQSTLTLPGNDINLGSQGGQLFTMINGATMTSGNASIAGADSTTGTLQLDLGSTLSLDGNIDVGAGNASIGLLQIGQGSQLSAGINASPDVLIGAAGGDGQAQLTNGGVLALNSIAGTPASRMSIGLGGTGSLQLDAASRVQIGQADGTATGSGGLFVGVGQGINGTGNVALSDAGTTIDIFGNGTNNLALLAVAQNQFLDGTTSTGSLMISNGAAVNLTNTNMLVGEGANATGTVSIATGGRLVIAGDNGTHNIGNGGTGLVDVLTGGAVTISSATNSAALNVGLLQGTGTLNVQDGGSLDLQGALAVGTSGTGNVQVTGTGRITVASALIGANGTLAGDGQFNADSLNVQAGGTLALSDLSGINNLAVDGAGAAIASGDDITLGTGVGPLALTLTGGAAANTQADINVGAGATVNISGVGSTLLGNNLVIDGGSFFLDAGATTTATNVTVTNGGLLAGSGTLTAPAVTIGGGGTLSPGFSPGDITINGDLVLNGGTMVFELAGTQPQQFDRINVNGDLNLLAGTVRVDLIDGFSPISGDTFDVLSVTGTLTQNPDVAFVFNGLGPDFEFSFRNDNQLTVGQIQFLAVNVAEIPGLTENQAGIGEALDSLCPQVEQIEDPTADEQDLDLLCGALRNSNNSEAQIIAAVSAISPDEIIATIDTLLRFTTVQHGNLSQRLNGLRSGAPRIDLAGLNIVTEHGSLTGQQLQNSFENLLGMVGGGAGSEDFARWGLFGDANYQRGDRDNDRATPGFDVDTINITLGADYRVTDELFIGLAAGYNEVDSDFDSIGGLTVKGTTLTVLGTYFNNKQYYVDALVTLGWNDVDSRRQIIYQDANGTVNRRARGSSDGNQLVYSIAGGKDFSKGKWIFGPHVGVNYAEVSVDAFQESGAGGLNMSLPDQVSRTQTGNVGFHASYTATPSWGVLVPYARLDFVHEFKDGGQSPDVRFANDRFAFDPVNQTKAANIQAPDSDANYIVWSLGMHAQFVNGFAAFVNYRSHAGLDDFNLHDLSVGVRLERAF